MTTGSPKIASQMLGLKETPSHSRRRGMTQPRTQKAMWKSLTAEQQRLAEAIFPKKTLWGYKDDQASQDEPDKVKRSKIPGWNEMQDRIHKRRAADLLELLGIEDEGGNHLE